MTSILKPHSRAYIAISPFSHSSLRPTHHSAPHREAKHSENSTHIYTQPHAVTKSLDKFIHYNHATGHDA